VSAGDEKSAGPAVVLYRCPTPTDFLCPCGAVARRLRKLGIEYSTERVPYRRKDRPEIAELTRQSRVPVLIDGEEIVHDSKRILQYLEHTRGRPDKPGDAGSTIEPDGNA
jgi:glutathione S-transferase